MTNDINEVAKLPPDQDGFRYYQSGENGLWSEFWGADTSPLEIEASFAAVRRHLPGRSIENRKEDGSWGGKNE
jgi:hypothetical protein